MTPMRLDDMRPGEVRRDDDGKFWHACAECGETGALDHEVRDAGRGRIDVEPSILCPHCGAHYRLQAGRAVPA